MRKKLFYNSYMLDSEQLQDLDKLISKGLKHTELENMRYTDMLTSEQELLEEAQYIIS